MKIKCSVILLLLSLSFCSLNEINELSLIKPIENSLAHLNENSLYCPASEHSFFNPRNLAFIYTEETVVSVDHQTVPRQSAVGLENNMILLTEPSGESNPQSKSSFILVDVSTNSYNPYEALPSPLPEPSCTNIGNFVRNIDQHLYFPRVSNNLPINCNNPANTFKIYYYVFIGNAQAPSLQAQSTQLMDAENIYNIQMDNFIVNSTKDTVVMMNYTNSQKTETYRGVVYISLNNAGYEPLSFNKYLYDGINDYTLSAKGFFIEKTVNFGFLYVRKDAIQEIILKIITVDNTSAEKEISVATTTDNILAMTTAWDNIRKLAYVVISFDTGTSIYIYEISIPEINVKFKNSFSFPNVSVINEILPLPYLNFIIIYGKSSSEPNSVSINVVKIDTKSYTFTIFSSANTIIMGLQTFYSLIYAINTQATIYSIKLFSLYMNTSSNERLSRIIPCMFFQMSVCQLACNQSVEGEDYVNRVCVKCINNIKNNKTKLYGNVCVEACPYGWAYDGNNKCYKCPTSAEPLLTFYDVFINACANKCTSSMSLIVDSVNKVCMDCQKLGKFNRSPPTATACIDVCDPSDVIDTVNGMCYACKVNGLYYYNRNCLATCPKYGIISDANTNACTVCPEINKYFNENSCVDTCPPGRMLKPNTPECVTCQSLLLFNNIGVCSETCADETGPDKNGDCRPCGQLGLLIFDKKCVETCPLYFVPNENGYCISCKEKGAAYFLTTGFSGICVATCPEPYIGDANNICYECYTRGLYKFRNECVNECPLYYVWNNKNECSMCPKGTYYEKGKCLTMCSTMTFTNITSICYHCDIYSKYNFLTSCVKTCPSYASQIEFYGYCDPCYLDERYLYNNTCVHECPPYSISLENNLCQRCRDKKYFYYNNTCHQYCPKDTYADVDNYFCLDSAFKGQSKNFCQNGGVYNIQTDSCNCSEGYYGYLCQYTPDKVKEIVKNFENTIISKVPISYARIDPLFTTHYIKWTQYYLSFIQEVQYVFSQGIYEDIYQKVSYLAKFGNSPVINSALDGIYLFDFYVWQLQGKYLNYIYNHIKKSSLSSNTINISPMNQTLRNLMAHLWNDKYEEYNKFSLMDFVKNFTPTLENTFSGAKNLFENYIKMAVSQKRLLPGRSFTDGNFFRVSMGHFRPNMTPEDDIFCNLTLFSQTRDFFVKNNITILNFTNFSNSTNNINLSNSTNSTNISDFNSSTGNDTEINKDLNSTFVNNSNSSPSLLQNSNLTISNSTFNNDNLTNGNLTIGNINSTILQNSTNGTNLTLGYFISNGIFSYNDILIDLYTFYNYKVCSKQVNMNLPNISTNNNSTSNLNGTISNQTLTNGTLHNSTNSTTASNKNPLRNLINIPADMPRTKQMSYYNISNCENYIRTFYNMSDNETFYVLGIEYAEEMNYDENHFNHISSSLSLRIVHPILGYDSTYNTEICPYNPIRYYLRLNGNLQFNDLIGLYQKIYQEHEINILDKNDPFFMKRCYRYNKNNSFSEYTLRQRSKFYFHNYTSQCRTYKNMNSLDSLCTASAITSDYFAVCDCPFAGEILNGIFPDYHPNFSKYNFDVFFCLIEAMKDGNDFINLGFIISISVFGLNILLHLLFLVFNKTLLSKELDRVITNDCISLDFDGNLFPTFYDLYYNTNIRSFQNQYENTIISNLKKDMKTSDLHKLDRLKHFGWDEENNQSAGYDRSANKSLALSISAGLTHSNISDRKEDKSFLKEKEKKVELKDIRKFKRDDINVFTTTRIEESASRIIRKIRLLYFTEEEKDKSNFTLVDLDCMDIKVRANLDKRSHCSYLLDYLVNYNLFFNAIFKRSLLVPQNARIQIFTLKVLLFGLFNCAFYFENLIEERSIEINRRDIMFTISFEFQRLILSYLTTTYCMLLYRLLFKIPKDIYLRYNVLLWTLDKNVIQLGNNILNNHLFFRTFANVLYYFSAIFSIFYISVFNAVYFNCVYGWIYSLVILLILDFVIIDFLIFPPLAMISRILTRKTK
jgi:hypothetical protein